MRRKKVNSKEENNVRTPGTSTSSFSKNLAKAGGLTAITKTTVRHVTGTGTGLLEENPQSGCTEIRAFQRATIGVLPTYATR
jgi:hypothetical protein